MKIASKIFREAADVCHGSRLYPLLSREEKKAAVMYCQKIIGKLNDNKTSGNA